MNMLLLQLLDNQPVRPRLSLGAAVLLDVTPVDRVNWKKKEEWHSP